MITPIAYYNTRDYLVKYVSDLFCLENSVVSSSEVMEKIKTVVGMLVSRKLDLYRDNKIVLYGYEFIDLGDKMALSIISSMGR